MEPVLLNSDLSMPRTDYPRPQWVRENWLCLNGEWQFAFDFSRSGKERGMIEGGEYPLTIHVPFCPESRLSGIGYTDFIPAVWYRREIVLDRLPEGRALLHFGAVDYVCEVYWNGTPCGTHKGGYSSFTLDVTAFLRKGVNILTVYAEDDLRSGRQPCGKQSIEYRSHACSYTRTTGIWQTVWMEFVPESYLMSARMTPHAQDGTLEILLKGYHTDRRTVRMTAFLDGTPVGTAEAHFSGETASALLSVSDVRLWEPGSPVLYDLRIELTGTGGNAADTVCSYFALRDIALTDRALTVNGKPVFLRMVLDQGFNPDGVCTAPDDAFLRRDIELAMGLGFNGARLHQRVFEERTLYWADKLGYLLWGEYANGIEPSDARMLEDFLPEWFEVLERDYSHPSIIGWCPFNETYHAMALDPETHRMTYRLTKMFDPHRPVIDASGGVHYDTDMFDVHDYEQDPEALRGYLAPMLSDPAVFHDPVPRYVGDKPRRPMAYKGQPYWVSEYGGTFWDGGRPRPESVWSYGEDPCTAEEFAARCTGLTTVLLRHPRVCGFCYTQLTDIEQEQNGLFRFDRSKKLPDHVYEEIRRAITQPAAIEE